MRFILLLLLLVSFNSKAVLITKEYDENFEDSAIFLPIELPWQVIKAQCYQESRLNKFAVSPVGAKGLCQFMPATWGDMQKLNTGIIDSFNATQSIMAASIYMNRLYNSWTAKRTNTDRIKLALASYNAGFGNILKAQKLAKANDYDSIISKLHLVTGHHHKETIAYVNNIMYKWLPII